MLQSGQTEMSSCSYNGSCKPLRSITRSFERTTSTAMNSFQDAEAQKSSPESLARAETCTPCRVSDCMPFCCPMIPCPLARAHLVAEVVATVRQQVVRVQSSVSFLEQHGGNGQPHVMRSCAASFPGLQISATGGTPLTGLQNDKPCHFLPTVAFARPGE